MHLKLLSHLHFLSLKVSLHQVTFLADKFATDITSYYLAYIKPRHNESIILNADDSNDMSIIIRSTNKH